MQQHPDSPLASAYAVAAEAPQPGQMQQQRELLPRLDDREEPPALLLPGNPAALSRLHGAIWWEGGRLRTANLSAWDGGVGICTPTQAGRWELLLCGSCYELPHGSTLRMPGFVGGSGDGDDYTYIGVGFDMAWPSLTRRSIASSHQC